MELRAAIAGCQLFVLIWQNRASGCGSDKLHQNGSSSFDGRSYLEAALNYDRLIHPRMDISKRNTDLIFSTHCSTLADNSRHRAVSDLHSFAWRLLQTGSRFERAKLDLLIYLLKFDFLARRAESDWIRREIVDTRPRDLLFSTLRFKNGRERETLWAWNFETASTSGVCRTSVGQLHSKELALSFRPSDYAGPAPLPLLDEIASAGPQSGSVMTSQHRLITESAALAEAIDRRRHDAVRRKSIMKSVKLKHRFPRRKKKLQTSAPLVSRHHIEDTCGVYVLQRPGRLKGRLRFRRIAEFQKDDLANVDPADNPQLLRWLGHVSLKDFVENIELLLQVDDDEPLEGREAVESDAEPRAPRLKVSNDY
jgi:hypothetical protein